MSLNNLSLSFLVAICKLEWAEETLQQLHANPSSALLPGLIEIAGELSHVPVAEMIISVDVLGEKYKVGIQEAL